MIKNLNTADVHRAPNSARLCEKKNDNRRIGVASPESSGSGDYVWCVRHSVTFTPAKAYRRKKKVNKIEFVMTRAKEGASAQESKRLLVLRVFALFENGAAIHVPCVLACMNEYICALYPLLDATTRQQEEHALLRRLVYVEISSRISSRFPSADQKRSRSAKE